LGLEAQRRLIQEYIGRIDGGEIIRDEFVDYETGKQDREQLRQALSYARRTGATVVVAKLDRLARNAGLFREIRDQVREWNVNVLFLDFPEVPVGPSGEFCLHMLALCAEFEGKLISERTRNALRVAKSKGRRLGASRPGSKRFTQEEMLEGREAASKARTAKALAKNRDVMLVIREKRAEGSSYREIAEILQETLGVSCRDGGPMKPARVKQLYDRACEEGIGGRVTV
jgi:DNA invertase Pin-like site-specific DNA recombinase